MQCYSRSRSRSFPGITTSHSRSQNSGMKFPFPFPFPKIGNEIFVPVLKSRECNLSFPFPFPKFGNELSHSRSHSQMSKSHSRSPLLTVPPTSTKGCIFQNQPPPRSFYFGDTQPPPRSVYFDTQPPPRSLITFICI